MRWQQALAAFASNSLAEASASHCPLYLLSSHQEEIDGSDVDANLVAEILEDLPDGGAGPQGEGGAGAVGEHHAAVPWRALPHANRVAIISLQMKGKTSSAHIYSAGVVATFSIRTHKVSGQEI